MRKIRPSARLLALLLAVCYLSLAVVGAACMFGEVSQASSAHHHANHAGKTSHSPLCAWACQAGPSVALVGLSILSFTLTPLFWSRTHRISIFGQIVWATARPRAPPFSLR